MSGQDPTQVDQEGDTCGVCLEMSFHANILWMGFLQWYCDGITS